jgi:hypothetical protein
MHPAVVVDCIENKRKIGARQHVYCDVIMCPDGKGKCSRCIVKTVAMVDTCVVAEAMLKDSKRSCDSKQVLQRVSQFGSRIANRRWSVNECAAAQLHTRFSAPWALLVGRGDCTTRRMRPSQCHLSVPHIDD